MQRVLGGSVGPYEFISSGRDLRYDNPGTRVQLPGQSQRLQCRAFILCARGRFISSWWWQAPLNSIPMPRVRREVTSKLTALLVELVVVGDEEQNT
jgi:hypothetical protein